MELLQKNARKVKKELLRELQALNGNESHEGIRSENSKGTILRCEISQEDQFMMN